MKTVKVDVLLQETVSLLLPGKLSQVLEACIRMFRLGDL